MKIYNNWKTDLKDSNKAIMSISKTILPQLISGEIYSIENVDNNILLMLDQCSGIDIIRKNEKGLQGVAVRVQFGHNYNTFTIREKRHTGNKTELEKRIEQIEGGYFYPAYTIQAYFNSRMDLNLKSIAIIDTKDLYKFIIDIKNNTLIYTNRSDNIFKFCYWKDLENYNCRIKIIDKSQ